MCGYQGWFRAPEDGSGRGWGHYAARNKFEDEFLTIDLWPDVSEYEKTYETAYKLPGGENARVFSSWESWTF